MKYTLNETPVRTSINYAINDISLELNIPDNKNFKDYKISNKNLDIKESIEKNFTSKIGLQLPTYKKYEINIKENTDLKEPVLIEYDIDNNLVDNIILNIEKNTNINFIIKYTGNGYHNLKINTNIKENSNIQIDLINLVDNNSKSFISFENIIEDNSYLKYNFIDLGGNIRLSNYYTDLLGNNSHNDFNNIYLGTNEDVIDMNYYVNLYGPNTKCNLDIQGAIDDNSKKSFKGTIDFKEGCINAIGEENENCIILSDNATSKSLPMLLCHEESVTGSHGVSSGKIDPDKLFYLMSRGLDINESKKLIINANYTNILNNLLDNSIKEEIISIINKKID